MAAFPIALQEFLYIDLCCMFGVLFKISPFCYSTWCCFVPPLVMSKYGKPLTWKKAVPLQVEDCSTKPSYLPLICCKFSGWLCKRLPADFPRSLTFSWPAAMHDVSSSCYHGSSPAGPRPGPPCTWRTWRTSRSAGRSERRWSRWHRCCFKGLLGDAGSFWGLGRCVLFFPQTVCPHWWILTVERRVPDQGAHSGLGHFTRKFSYKVALVKFWHAFRLRRLAQNVCPVLGSIWAAAFFL